MKLINQKNEFDCLQATLANFLGIEYDAIPDFYKSFLETGDPDKFEEDVDKFLSSMNLFRIVVPMKKNLSGGYCLPYFCSLNRYRCIGVLAKKDRAYSHAVILEIKRDVDGDLEIDIYHDPKKNTDYDINDLVQIEFVLKK